MTARTRAVATIYVFLRCKHLTNSCVTCSYRTYFRHMRTGPHRSFWMDSISHSFGSCFLSRCRVWWSPLKIAMISGIDLSSICRSRSGPYSSMFQFCWSSHASCGLQSNKSRSYPLHSQIWLARRVALRSRERRLFGSFGASRKCLHHCSRDLWKTCQAKHRSPADIDIDLQSVDHVSKEPPTGMSLGDLVTFGFLCKPQSLHKCSLRREGPWIRVVWTSFNLWQAEDLLLE